jgi:hypothetical protein
MRENVLQPSLAVLCEILLIDDVEEAGCGFSLNTMRTRAVLTWRDHRGQAGPIFQGRWASRRLALQLE